MSAVRDLFMSIGFDGASASRGLQDLDRKVDDVKRSIGGLGADAGRMGATFETQMSGLDKSFTLWEKNAGQFTTTMERKQRRLEMVTDKASLLENEIASTRSELSRVSSEFGSGSEAAQRLENQLLDLQIQQAETNREMKALTTFDWSKLDRIGDRFTDMGKAMTLGVTTPLLAIGGLGLRTFVQLEDAWAGVEKVTSGSIEEMAALRQEMHDLVTTGGVPLAVQDMYEIAQAAGRLGIAREYVVGFAETAAMLGTVTNMTAEGAANDMAQFATVMQTPQRYFDRLGATLVGLGNNMAATESDIMRMGARLTGAGNTIGLAESEVLGFAAAFSALGINAEAGGTAFTNVMLSMQDSIFNADERLDTFARVAGKSVDDFADLFKKDAASAIVYFVEGLGHLTEAGYNTNEIFSELNFNGVNITDLLRRGAGAGDTLREAINLANVSWYENEALVEAAGKRYATTAAQIQVFRNNLTLLSNQIGIELSERFGNLIGIGTRLLEWLGNLNPETRSMVVTIGLVAAAIGPVLLGIGHAIKMVNKMRETVQTLGRGIKTFKGLVVTGAKKVGAFAVSIGKGTVKLVGHTKAMALKTKAYLANKAQVVANGAAMLASKAKTAAVTGVIKAKTAAQWLLNKALLANPIGKVITAIVGLITIGVALWKNWDTVREKAGILWEGLKNIFGNIRDFIVNIVGNIGSFLEERFPAVFGFITGHLGILRDTFFSIFEGIKDIFRGVIDFVAGVFTGDWGRAWEGVKSVFTGIFSTLGAVLKAPINMIINMINGVIGAINGISISVPGWVPVIGGNTLGFDLPKIPMLAKGTDNHIGGPAIVGEKGPELVILPQGTSVTPADETRKILSGLGMLKQPPAPDIGGLTSTIKGLHQAQGSPIVQTPGTPAPTDPGIAKAIKAVGYHNRAEKPDTHSIRKLSTTPTGSGKTPPAKLAAIENKVEVTIQQINLGDEDATVSTKKKEQLKQMFKEIFVDCWEEAWYALCLKYPNLTEA